MGKRLPYNKAYHLEYANYITPRENIKTPIYNWFTFRHAFGKSLVFGVLENLNLNKTARVLDPFCGSGTTILACKEKGISAIGLDILPLSTFITNVKLRSYSPKKLLQSLDYLLNSKRKIIGSLPEIPIVNKSFTPAIIDEILSLRGAIRSISSQREKDFFTVALIRIIGEFSKTLKDGAFLRLIPDKRINKSRFLPTFIKTSQQMIEDIESYKFPISSNKDWSAYQSDVRNIPRDHGMFDAIITSPPYLNRHDYTRIYSLELALEFIQEPDELIKLRYSTFCSHPESKTNLEENDFDPPTLLSDLLRTLSQSQGIDLRIFRMIKGYFIDLFRAIQSIDTILKPGGKIVFVLGNVRFAGITIPVDQITVQIAAQRGWKCNHIWTARLRGNSPQQMKSFGKVCSSENIIFFSKP